MMSVDCIGIGICDVCFASNMNMTNMMANRKKNIRGSPCVIWTGLCPLLSKSLAGACGSIPAANGTWRQKHPPLSIQAL